jgi:DNA-binding response OmpR family regulator
VLVVDDDATTLAMAEAMLTDAGYDVALRDTALGTAAEIMKNRPDFVLLDLNMPALPGDQIARVLSSGNRLGQTRLIFHSSRPEAELQALVESHGALGYIHKGSGAARFIPAFQALVRRASAA